MLWFNNKENGRLQARVSNFNTSYVMVQRLNCGSKLRKIHISIHLMLWFNFSDKSTIALSADFNTSYVMVQLQNYFALPLLLLISIHLMLWFNSSAGLLSVIIHIFQYILCYGSTNINHKKDWYLKLFQYILCYGSTEDAIKIRKLSEKNFNTSYVMVQRKTFYNLRILNTHFNTSYVMVQRIQRHTE